MVCLIFVNAFPSVGTRFSFKQRSEVTGRGAQPQFGLSMLFIFLRFLDGRKKNLDEINVILKEEKEKVEEVEVETRGREKKVKGGRVGGVYY